ncbi:MAG: hypothetical protein HUU34_04015 [Saprospiraceae bacterium]|jgi:hypothetical protein|nr:hypothetical protein [Saprospiraceae bacterium]
MKSGQPYLFKGHPDWSFANEASYWVQRIQFVGPGNQVLASGDVSYDATARQVNFAIPSGQLPTDKIIQMRMMNVPVLPDEDIEANVTAVQTELANMQNSDADTSYTRIILEERIAEGVQRGRKAKDFYKHHFRTSMFSTFVEKMNALNTNINWFNPILLDPNQTSGLSIDDFGCAVSGNELFDVFDQDGYFNGDDQIKPIIRPEADLNVTQASWYNSIIYPYMYQHFPAPAQGITLSWRNPAILGNVPAKAVWLQQEATPHRLT